MKYEVVPNSCRICLRQTKKLRSIYKPSEEGDEPPNEMLHQIAGIILEEADAKETLPKFICKTCELSLNMAFQFRIKAIKSQRIIDLYCSSKTEKQQEESMQTVKAELAEFMDVHESLEEDYVEEEKLDSKDMNIEELVIMTLDANSNKNDEEIEFLDETYLDDDEEEDHIPCEEIANFAPEVDPQSPSENNVAALINEKVVSIDEQSFDIIEVFEEQSCQQSKRSAENKKPNKSISSKRRSRKRKHEIEDSKSHFIASKKYATVRSSSRKSEVETATPAVKVVPMRQKKVKNITADNGHICDICGNIYSKRSRMMEHRRRHDKELRYACEFCDLRFHLREKLRKHMFSHSGGKPLKCSYCSRTFFYESVKKAHEAIHEGHKPYICQECNKPFAYPHALKKHKLIHENIKLYHCELCNKEFRLKHHVKQHIETKMHQNAVRSVEEENIS